MTALSKTLTLDALHPLRNFNKLAFWRTFKGLSLFLALMVGGGAYARAATDTILVVGDSLSAEYGLKRGTGWVPLLEKQLALEKKTAKVINASISGDTTSGGRSRLGALLATHKPTVVVIELGGNDALRGLPLDMTEKKPAGDDASCEKNRCQGAAAGHAGAAQLWQRVWRDIFRAFHKSGQG